LIFPTSAAKVPPRVEGEIMSIQAVLLPVFVLILLTFVLGFWVAYLRVQAVRSGEVKPRDVTLREPNWPPRVLKVLYAFENQLELPLLFYVLTILAWITKQADLLFVVMAWVFVVLRVLHAGVHITSNRLSQRFGMFAASVIVLLVMWVIFIVRIMLP
jgi:hypothetical protein